MSKQKEDGVWCAVVTTSPCTFGLTFRFFKACRINRANDMLREALGKDGRLKPKAIEHILNDQNWANRYISCLDNNETIRECELLTADMIAEEIVKEAESGEIRMPSGTRSFYGKGV